MSATPAPRVGVVWCPSWPLIAAGKDPTQAAAIVHTNRIMAVTPAASERGVSVGLRRREAQSRCADLDLVEHDVSRDMRWFEPVVAAFEDISPRVEVTVPGLLTFHARGPSRYLGGDLPMAQKAALTVDAAVAEVLEKLGVPGAAHRLLAACVGVAEGHFAATLAAQLQTMPLGVEVSGRPGCLVVAEGDTRAFLEPFGVEVLTRTQLAGSQVSEWDRLVDLLSRLGMRTLGEFAKLGAGDVTGRLGPEGVVAHRLAAGMDPRPVSARPVPPEMITEVLLDPPIYEVEAAGFLARGLADELHSKLANRGIACTCVAIEVRTEHGEEHVRLWRQSGAFSASDIADRMRWQLDGWLSSSLRPTGPLELLRLIPDVLVPDKGSQLDLWGEQARATDDVVRAVTRLQGLLGHEAVRLLELCGGRGPGEQVRWIPAQAASLRSDRRIETPDRIAAPWPGRVPSPSPAYVPVDPERAELNDEQGNTVEIDARGALSGSPASVVIARGEEQVDAWAGPWPSSERWWDPAGEKRRARMQILTADGRAYLLVREAQKWWLEATYD
jgi:protein ImuB